MVDTERFLVTLQGFRYDPRLLQRPGQTLGEALVSFHYGINCLGQPGDQERALAAYKRSVWA